MLFDKTLMYEHLNCFSQPGPEDVVVPVRRKCSLIYFAYAC